MKFKIFTMLFVAYIVCGLLLRDAAKQKLMRSNLAHSIVICAIVLSNNGDDKEHASKVFRRSVRYSEYCFLLDYIFFPFRIVGLKDAYLDFGCGRTCLTLPCNAGVALERSMYLIQNQQYMSARFTEDDFAPKHKKYYMVFDYEFKELLYAGTCDLITERILVCCDSNSLTASDYERARPVNINLRNSK